MMDNDKRIEDGRHKSTDQKTAGRRRSRQPRATITTMLFLFVIGAAVLVLNMKKMDLQHYTSSYSDTTSFFYSSSSSSLENIIEMNETTTKAPAPPIKAPTNTQQYQKPEITIEVKMHASSSIFQQRLDEYFLEERTYKDQEGELINVIWIRKYLYWHNENRQKFLESSIFYFQNISGDNSTETLLESRKLPKSMIVYMDPNTSQGGLTDRFKGLGHFLWMAYKESRVLFLKWYDAPLQLEDFLVPNLFNWTLPSHPNLKTPEKLRGLFGSGNSDDRENQQVRLVSFVSPVGNYLKPFNLIFDTYFIPSRWVQDGINDAYKDLNLIPGQQQYDAVHLRIGHPAFRNKKRYDAKSERLDKYGENDSGLIVKAINAATRAISCTKYLIEQQQQQHQVPLYFFSDSIELIQAVINNNTTTNNATILASALGNRDQILAYQRLQNATNYYPGRIVGRSSVPIAHLERRQQNTTTTKSSSNNEAHKNTFVDLYIASKARCLSLGIGRYAYMAGKISSLSPNNCWIRHAAEADSTTTLQWGMKLMYKEVPKCPYTT